ncbi:MAG: DUF3501 family protein [Gammaproteobacteria bacterium]|nr:DUF3501 family protein [Gammaproteobacteria bacterium]MDH5802508.1 DUF3501 family protein [Gammaproteobacteria bacterium]
MEKLTRASLLSLEEYAQQRSVFRQKVIDHKKNRQVPLGPHLTLYFEDQLTMQYQVQEMLRVERIFEAEGIAEELDVYNPLIPDGSNWKATMMLEYADVSQRQAALAQLVGVEEKVWVQVHGYDKVYALADEDLERSDANKTSAVHFMRFELTASMCAAAKQGAGLTMGVEHPDYTHTLNAVPENIAKSLVSDLD